MFTGQRSKFGCALAALCSGLLLSGSALAQSDPPGCDSTGVSITIQARVGGAPTTGPVTEGDAITYRVVVGHPGGTSCNFEGGQLSVTLPDNTLVELAGFGGSTPDVPLITDISPFQIDVPVPYIADRADLRLQGSTMVLVARADYGATGFRPGQENGTFLTDPPQNTATASTSFPLQLLFCGDGIVSEGEECDDGNDVNEDGCRNDCTLPFCGDGIVDPDEECDDGNDVNEDGCRNDCTLPFCGDGIVDPDEECDDGNDINDDGCRNDCTLPFCGDGIVDSNEECDDGNDINEDGCRNDCTLPFCGDGIVDPDEECDDGNEINDDGCRNDCTLPFCGDGILDPGEECDDGNNVDGDGCSATCEEEGEFAGCTPGFWKQPHHLQFWMGYDPEDLFNDVFGVDYMEGLTLLEALRMGGGHEIALGRHAVAALLNAASDEVNYFYTTDEIIAMVQEAFATGNFNMIKGMLEEQNEQGCTVDKSGMKLQPRENSRLGP